ncbi:MAG: VWA domain-containing protein [Myxococcota bacterium]
MTLDPTNDMRAPGAGLVPNLVRFARFLRRAGVPVGTGQVEDAVRALELMGIDHRRDVFWALHSVFVSRREHDELFGYAFAAFWRDPSGRNDELAELQLPHEEGRRKDVKRPPRRILEAWRSEQKKRVLRAPEGDTPDTPGSASHRERLRRRDFEQMSTQEIEEVKRLFRMIRFPWREKPVRRTKRHPRGNRFDLRGTLQRSLRTGGEPLELAYRRRSTRPPPLVVLCDISGSMERYSRMLLHFLHALTNDRDRVEIFTFGTRLTRITRSLQHRDVDLAFEDLSTKVPDWGGGTRIAPSLKAFNDRWARRLLTRGAEVLLITDGLERPDPDDVDGPRLDREMGRLARFARRIRWLNPLLRFEGFQPEASGVKTLLAHVSEHRPVHDLASLEQLARALAS